MRPLQHLAAAIAVIIGIAACPQPANAASPELQRQAKQMANTAAKLFKKKHYKEAATLFEQAFALDPDRDVRLRNAGRAYEEAGMLGNALRCFEKFEKITDSDKLKKDAQQRIARFKEAGAQARTASGTTIARPAPKPATPTPTPAVKPVIAAKKQPVQTRPNWLITGSGGAILVAGVGLFVYANGVGGDIDTHESAGHYQYSGGASKLADDRSAVSTNQTAGIALAGAGALIAGAGWFLLRDEVKDVSIAPSLGPDRRGIAARWSF